MLSLYCILMKKTKDKSKAWPVEGRRDERQIKRRINPTASGGARASLMLVELIMGMDMAVGSAAVGMDVFVDQVHLQQEFLV